MLNVDTKNRCTEFAVTIGNNDQRGLGYGREAVEFILEYCFMERGFHRVYLRAFGFNKAAIRFYEKCGFSHEGNMREALFRDGRFHDIVIMGMLEDEYRCGR